MSKKILTIWFDKKGNMLERASSWMTGAGAHHYNNFSEPGEDFDDTLVFNNMYEYKSARVFFKSKKTGRKYCMFLDTFGDLLKLNRFINNEVAGKFRFTKRGQAQGIKLILNPQEEDRLKEKDEDD